MQTTSSIFTMADFKSELRKDQYKVLLLSRCQQKKKQKEAEPTQERKPKQNNPKPNKPKEQQTNNEGWVISWSVHDVGNLKKGDSIVSSMVSSSGLEWRSNKTRQNRQTITKAAIHELCEIGNQHNTARKPGLPPARSPEITQCKPHGQQSSQNWGNPEASNGNAM